MKNSELFSKAWCDLIFQGRNQDYGAYKLRRNAGRRTRFALIIVGVGALLAIAVPMGLSLYVRYKIYSSFKDVGAEVHELKRMDQKEGYTTKCISAGRGAPAVSTIKGAAENQPDIVDEVAKEDIVFGVNGPETFIVDNERQLFEDLDTLHNRNRQDLPIEGAQLVAVEVVEEMPQFPGGPTALMSWLDANVAYPKSCIDAKVEGDMEVMFYVRADGSVADARITKSLHPELDRAVLHAIGLMPRWTPGKEGARFTAVCITLPLHFQIN